MEMHFFMSHWIKPPSVSTSLTGNNYLDAMKDHFQNNVCSNCKNFKIIESYTSSSNGKSAYITSFSFQNSDTSPVTKTRHIEIPENGKTWRISNDYNTNNPNGEISYSTLLSSFKKPEITTPERKETPSANDDYSSNPYNKPINPDPSPPASPTDGEHPTPIPPIIQKNWELIVVIATILGIIAALSTIIKNALNK